MPSHQDRVRKNYPPDPRLKEGDVIHHPINGIDALVIPPIIITRADVILAPTRLAAQQILKRKIYEAAVLAADAAHLRGWTI